MAFALPPLPFAKEAFGDVLSSRTFDYHHGRHHNAYVNKTNSAIADTDRDRMGLIDVIRAAHEGGDAPLFNASAQIWNHSFYWQCLSPEKQNPSGKLAGYIEDSFGSKSALFEALKAEAKGHFASGWAWLILNGDRLDVLSLHDADTPVVQEGMIPLLTIDVWEHAYYLDYENGRGDYVDALLDHAINWEFVAKNLDGEGLARADQEPAAL
jgi:Fe-Mn family superoxide dismutase